MPDYELHLNPGATYGGVYRDGTRIDLGDSEDVTVRLLERLGVTVKYDVEAVNEGGDMPTMLAPTYDVSLDPCSPDFDMGTFGAFAWSTIQDAHREAVDPQFPWVHFHEPTKWIDRTLQTASWWDEYEIQPGRYEFKPVTLGHKPYVPGIPAGYVGDSGPYYGQGHPRRGAQAVLPREPADAARPRGRDHARGDHHDQRDRVLVPS